MIDPMRRTAALLAVLLGLVATTRSSAQQEQQPPAPTFRTDINFVRVDVIVSDGKGQPVTDLTQADVEITEDGQPQTIEQFRLIRIDGNPRPGDPPPRQIRNPDDEQIELSREDSRLFVFFFDDYHVRLGNSIYVREPLSRFVREQLRPNDIVGIMYPLTPVNDVSFTRNHAQVESAIQRFEGRKFDYRPRNLFEEQYARYPTETVERVRNQVVMTALRGLAARLGGVREGRKSIIYVSEGLTAMLPPQMRNQDALLGPINNPVARNPSVGENNPREETAAFFASTDLLSEMREVFTAANRNNTAIYGLDPRGLAVNEFGIDEAIGPNQDRRALQMTQDTLRTLSEETDGRAIVNRNDLVAGLAQVVRDASFYYLIGYTSSQAPTDGKFHEIKVNVRRRGVDVRARKGYWAFNAEDAKRAVTPVVETAKPIQQALASISTSVQSGKYVRTWLGTARGEGGKTRVTLIWEPLPQVPGVRRDAPGRVAVIAANQRGDLVFRGRSPDAAVASAAPPASTSAAGARVPTAPAAAGPQRIVFDAPPGSLDLRLTVEAAEGGTLDQEQRTITVPDLTAPDATISTPRVHRVRTVRELQTVAADATAVPVAAREFSRTERLLIRFDVYGAAAPTALLMNRNGRKVADVPIAAATAGGTHQIDLGLNTVAPGEYLVEITSGEVKELVAFRITG
ncbi:MAG: VWA domain-containing protein [Acidimicrobiia bacterium]|nr:VWA domain-containing protein [Acidimicrobiia bacterium]